MIINIIKDSVSDSEQPKVYDLGQITTTLQDLLNESNITITDERLIILKIQNIDDSFNFYLLPIDYKGNSVYGYGKEIVVSDLIPIGIDGGGGTPPNLGEVLTQGNRAPLAVNANRVFTLEDRTKNLYSLFDLSTTVSLTLNNSVAYDLGDVLKIQHYVGVDGSEASTMNLVFDSVTVFYGNDLITSFSIPYGAVAYLEKILSSVWTLSYKLAQDIGGSVTPSTLISTDADNALVVGSDSKLFAPIINTPFEVQITQTVIDEPPVMLLGSLQGNRGATITPSHVSTGIYKLTADIDIFKDLKDCYKRTDYFDVQILKFNGLSLGISWYWYCLDDYTLEIVVEDGLFGSPADELLTNNVLIKAEYKN